MQDDPGRERNPRSDRRPGDRAPGPAPVGRSVARGRRVRVGLALALAACPLAATVGSGGAGTASDWPVGEGLAVGVEAGVARFVVPTPRDGSKVLVVVSSLATVGGPFDLSLSATPSPERPTALDRAIRGAPAAPAPEPPPAAAPMPAPAVGLPPAERDFSLLARGGDPASAESYRRVHARLRAAGRWVQVYVDEADVARVGPAVLRDLVGTFEERVLPTAVRLFGPAADVDGDGRFTILLSGRVGRLAEGRPAADGFVRGADFDAHVPDPFGNRADLLYLDAGLEAGPYLRTVLAHEYAHAVTFCRKVVDRPAADRRAADEEGWLDEGIAHLVEDLHGFSRRNLDYRVRAFLAAPERYRLVVEDYYRADLFRSHGNRGSTYLFLRWCADRFGPGLLPRLVRSPLRGVANLEAATGVPFADLYREWSTRLYLDSLAPTPAGRRPEAEATPPRATFLEVGAGEDTWSASGTTSHYVVLGASPTGAAEVTVRGPAGAALQVTAVRLPDDLPRLALAAHPGLGPDGEPVLRLAVEERDGASVRLESLDWGPLVPRSEAGSRRRGTGTRDGDVRLGGPVEARELAPHGRRELGPIPLDGAGLRDGPLSVRVVGIDGRGRRFAAWIEVDPFAAEGTPPAP